MLHNLEHHSTCINTNNDIFIYFFHTSFTRVKNLIAIRNVACNDHSKEENKPDNKFI